MPRSVLAIRCTQRGTGPASTAPLAAHSGLHSQEMSLSPNGYGDMVGFGRDRRGKGKKFNQQRSAGGLLPRCILRKMSWEPLVMFSGQLLVRVCPNKLLARFCMISESCSQQALWGN